jgi:hypothetical protein
MNKTYEEGKDVFVYGKIEQNFNSLKKEYLIEIAVSSMQEHQHNNGGSREMKLII